MLKLPGLLLLVMLCPSVLGDVYFHNPRGSNNRLNEDTATRDNANRLFDSQNNARGGYNVGDTTSEPSETENEQYNMKYFQSAENYKQHDDGKGKSYLTFEWTNQHGCGVNTDDQSNMLNCNVVIQYMCQPDNGDDPGDKDNIAKNILRNGVDTDEQQYEELETTSEKENSFERRFRKSVKADRGLHESMQYYDNCYLRQRNMNLFRADQNLPTKILLEDKDGKVRYVSAAQTRQNPRMTRYGYECPEERDYYPYWHPSPWKDMAVMTSHTELCNTLYKSKSFNVQPYHECVETFNGADKNRHYSRWNNEKQCKDNGGVWQEFHNYLEKADVNGEAECNRLNNAVASTINKITYIWAVPYDSVDRKSEECLVKLDQPECLEAPWTRTNHLGNGRDGVATNYTWTIPYFPSGNAQRCVARIRYNITTDDYDPWNTFSGSNAPLKTPISNNPLLDIGAGISPLRLNINTAQFGRTFQDRSHVFQLVMRPQNAEDKTIFNLNVRGKRGNIVQVFPAVEYDFIPNDLHMTTDDLVHIQWTGSNTHDNGNPAGDGQAGDAGQGEGGTDRSNFVQIRGPKHSYPVPFEKTIFNQSPHSPEVVWSYNGVSMTGEDLALNLATSGYYDCRRNCERPQRSGDNIDAPDKDLNEAPASYPGVLLRPKISGEMHYMSSRNNAFTNRSQKGKITVGLKDGRS